MGTDKEIILGMNNLLMSHYFFLPARWMTSAEVLILNIILGTERTYQSFKKDNWLSKYLLNTEYTLLLGLMLAVYLLFSILVKIRGIK